MRPTRILFYGLLLTLTMSTLQAQEPATKKQPEPTKEAEKKESAPTAKDVKLKGQQLPFYWAQIGLSDAQRKDVYTVQAKYDAEIALLEAKIEALKSEMAKERFKLLSDPQKQRLEEIIRRKIGGGG